jgi:hypothetical protein
LAPWIEIVEETVVDIAKNADIWIGEMIAGMVEGGAIPKTDVLELLAPCKGNAKTARVFGGLLSWALRTKGAKHAKDFSKSINLDLKSVVPDASALIKEMKLEPIFE